MHYNYTSRATSSYCICLLNNTGTLHDQGCKRVIDLGVVILLPCTCYYHDRTSSPSVTGEVVLFYGHDNNDEGWCLRLPRISFIGSQWPRVMVMVIFMWTEAWEAPGLPHMLYSSCTVCEREGESRTDLPWILHLALDFEISAETCDC